ncbi:MAG: hypothetical protein ABI472_02335 [Ginsengibacter sp.]
MNPNSPFWPVYLWWLIHHGDPGPDDRIFRNVLTAGILIQVASTMRDEHVQSALRSAAGSLFEGILKQS